MLYRLNVNRLVVRTMVAGHVYADPRRIPAEQMREKQQVIAASGARFGSAAFVTGGLDRVSSREDFLALARHTGTPILVAYAAATPPRSRAEMVALASLPAVRSVVVPRGKLSFYEEYPNDACAEIEAFLSQSANHRNGPM